MEAEVAVQEGGREGGREKGRGRERKRARLKVDLHISPYYHEDARPLSVGYRGEFAWPCLVHRFFNSYKRVMMDY
ncbi:hypothetical protein TIFTF001_015231 [Ficus carica]|uniref:Uncharacterized protein n=1 Tax=Ficus carica TaxID=3494 RepID=A0AA88D7P1_FICCA|nr:hypothetical protein TIFTF001_015231 [Ficus carica]